MCPQLQSRVPDLKKPIELWARRQKTHFSLKVVLSLMVQELMPVLPDLCMCDDLSIRGHALAVACGILSALGLLTGTHQAEIMAVIAPTMPTWISIFKHALAASNISAPDLKAKTEVRNREGKFPSISVSLTH